MKKIWVIMIIFGICVIISWLIIGISETQSLSPAIKKSITTTIETPRYSILEINDLGSVCQVTLILHFTPNEEFELITIATSSCAKIVNILKSHSLKRDVSVWLQKPTQKEGFSILYGRSYYSETTGEVKWISAK